MSTKGIRIPSFSEENAYDDFDVNEKLRRLRTTAPTLDARQYVEDLEEKVHELTGNGSDADAVIDALLEDDDFEGANQKLKEQSKNHSEVVDYTCGMWKKVKAMVPCGRSADDDDEKVIEIVDMTDTTLVADVAGSEPSAKSSAKSHSASEDGWLKAVKERFATAKRAMQKRISNWVSSVKSIVASIIKAARRTIRKIGDAIASFFITIKDSVTNLIKGVADVCFNVWHGTKERFFRITQGDPAKTIGVVGMAAGGTTAAAALCSTTAAPFLFLGAGVFLLGGAVYVIALCSGK